MEPEGSLPYQQEPTTGPCTESTETSPRPQTIYIKDRY